MYFKQSDILELDDGKHKIILKFKNDREKNSTFALHMHKNIN